MTFDPDDFQDQAAIAAMLQRQRMINSQNQQQSIPKNRQCPWCGGLLPGPFDKCQHCSSEVSWVAGYPCKPQNADSRREQIKKEQEAADKLKLAISLRVVGCKICRNNVPQRDLISTVKLCHRCKKWINASPAIIIITLLSLMILGFIRGVF